MVEKSPRTSTEKILVGIPTYSGGEYCRDALIQNLSAIPGKNVAFLFVTNSGEADKKDLLERTKKLSNVTVQVTDSLPDTKEQVVANRNAIREYFLKGDYAYLYFVDHDILQPSNALDVLLSHKKAVITGWYPSLFTYNGKTHLLPMVYGRVKENISRQLKMSEVLRPRLLKITCAGLGCTLITRAILEKVAFVRGKGTEDAMFYEAVRNDCDENLWLDTRVACAHLKFPVGDRRNHHLDPRNYVLKK